MPSGTPVYWKSAPTRSPELMIGVISTPGCSDTSIGRAAVTRRASRWAIADPDHADVIASVATNTVTKRLMDPSLSARDGWMVPRRRRRA